MNDKQIELVEKLEYAIAHMLHDKKKKLAKVTSVILDYLRRGEYVVAMIEAEDQNLDSLAKSIRETFDLKPWR